MIRRQTAGTQLSRVARWRFDGARDLLGASGRRGGRRCRGPATAGGRWSTPPCGTADTGRPWPPAARGARPGWVRRTLARWREHRPLGRPVLPLVKKTTWGSEPERRVVGERRAVQAGGHLAELDRAVRRGRARRPGPAGVGDHQARVADGEDVGGLVGPEQAVDRDEDGPELGRGRRTTGPRRGRSRSTAPPAYPGRSPREARAGPRGWRPSRGRRRSACALRPTAAAAGRARRGPRWRRCRRSAGCHGGRLVPIV